MRIQKVLTTKCPREMHVLMLKNESEGGFSGARKDGKVRFSENTLRYYWPNWLVQMNDSHKMMCACDTCTVMGDLHTAMKAKRTKLITAATEDLNHIDDEDEKEQCKKELENYKSEVLSADGIRHKHEDEFGAADEYGCGVRIDVGGSMFPHFSCILHKCDECTKQDYQAPQFERDCPDDEMISYSRFSTHCKCYAHGSQHIQSFETKPYDRCGMCMQLSEEQRRDVKARVQRIKLRTLHHELLSTFIAKEGTYATQLKKMLSHKYRVFLSGSKRKKKTRYAHAKKRMRTLFTEQDFSERATLQPNGQAQHEYFNQDESLGIEGISILFKPKGKDKFETRFYSILSTEKAQDGNVVYTNICMVLHHLLEYVEEGAEVGMEFSDGLLEILSDTDGCSSQYRSGNALFLLQKLATEMNIIYDRSIDVEGHGKRMIDGYSGTTKTHLSKAFRCDVEYQPEAVIESKKTFLLYKMANGERVDLADICCKILKEIDSSKVDPVKPRKEKVHSETAVALHEVMVRKKGEAKWGGISKKAVGFLSGKGNGIKAHYNFRFERLLGGEFVYRRVACSCDGCFGRLQEPGIEKYDRPSDNCVLWPIMEKKDGSGSGLNDWGKASFEDKNDADEAVSHAVNADTLRELGHTLAKEIEVGNVGAYSVNGDPAYEYYLITWEEVPQRAEKDEVFQFGEGDKYLVRKGDWYCKGTWFQKVDGARNWWTKHGQECIVKLESVLNADVMLLPRSDETPINASTWGKLHSSTQTWIQQQGAWRVSDDSDLFMVEESRRRGVWDYDEEQVREVREES